MTVPQSCLAYDFNLGKYLLKDGAVIVLHERDTGTYTSLVYHRANFAMDMSFDYKWLTDTTTEGGTSIYCFDLTAAKSQIWVRLTDLKTESFTI